MVDRERRQDVAPRAAALRMQLNDEQLVTLRGLESFGWELKFIRRPPFQEPIPVVVDGDRKSFAVLRADGTLDETSGLQLRA